LESAAVVCFDVETVAPDASDTDPRVGLVKPVAIECLLDTLEEPDEAIAIHP